jgi:Flp pilus assembly protein TadD
MSKKCALVVAVVAALWTGGVVAAGEPSSITTDELLSGALLGSGADPTTSIESRSVLALSDEMREFLRENVNPGATDTFKLQQLVDALMGTKDFRLEYDENTRTAAETFHVRKGNCLSFTTLFVALARGAGLNADFQEVDIPPDWSTRTNVFVLNLHINVKVNLGASGSRAVDFNIGDFQSTYRVEEIPDKRAIAHFFNNMGVERMQTGEILDAFAFFRRAILETGGKFSPAWTNLGLLYWKNGHDDYAEAAYLQAIKVDKNDAVAMSNLVRLYEAAGDRQDAQEYKKKVDQHRMRNPRLRFALARAAFDDGDYDAAIDHLRQAIRMEKDKGEYYVLLGMCYVMKGDPAKGRRLMAKAEKVAETDEERQYFSDKIRALLLASGAEG